MRRLPEEENELLAFIDSNLTDNPGQFHNIWESYRYDEPPLPLLFYTRFGNAALENGQLMLAYDVLLNGRKEHPENPDLGRLFARTLQRCGYPERSREILEQSVANGHSDIETLGLLGSVYKTIWLDRRESDDLLVKSRDIYEQSFVANGDYYTGINAATLSRILGNDRAAAGIAERVMDLCRETVEEDNVWIPATTGEACLLLDRPEEALFHYRKAMDLCGTNYSWIASMRRQLILMSEVMKIDAELLELVHNPPIVAFIGHMLDHPGRETSRFPKENAGKVKQALMKHLQSLSPTAGYSSAACGGDVLFLECLQEEGIETDVVLPFDRESFFETSVNFAGEEWITRTENAIAGCSRVEQVSRGSYMGDDVLFSYANQILMGNAILRSRLIETDPILVALWNGDSRINRGGTAESLKYWLSRDRQCRVINPDTGEIKSLESYRPETVLTTRPAEVPRKGTMDRSLISMLFADLVGYSKLREDQVPLYIDSFLGEISDRLSSLMPDVKFLNTWGDALFVVFDTPATAAEYSLQLRDLIKNTNWEEKGLPAEMNIRIGLHTGPVYEVNEPILNRRNFFGSHINQAARIEPVTSPGNVYVSEAFASHVACECPESYSCKYVGVVVLPKSFGDFPLYQLNRKS